MVGKRIAGVALVAVLSLGAAACAEPARNAQQTVNKAKRQVEKAGKKVERQFDKNTGGNPGGRDY